MKTKVCLLFVLPLLLLAGCGEDLSSTSESSSSHESSVQESSSTSTRTWSEITQDGDVSVLSAPDEIVIGATNSYSVDLSFRQTIYNSEARFSVSDPSVLPLEALEYHGQGDGSLTTSGSVRIDATKLSKTGQAYLEIGISSPNSSSQGGTVCVLLDIVDTPDVTYWNETVVFEGTSAFQGISLEEGEKLIAHFSDADHVLGIDNPNRAGEENETYSWFERDLSALLKGEESVSVSFRYAVGHDITLRVYVQDAEGKALTWYEINDALGQGSSQTGFDEYDRETARVTFRQDNSSLTLTITDRTYD